MSCYQTCYCFCYCCRCCHLLALFTKLPPASHIVLFQFLLLLSMISICKCGDSRNRRRLCCTQYIRSVPLLINLIFVTTTIMIATAKNNWKIEELKNWKIIEKQQRQQQRMTDDDHQPKSFTVSCTSCGSVFARRLPLICVFYFGQFNRLASWEEVGTFH